MHIETVTVLEQKEKKIFGGDYRILKFASKKVAAEVKPGQFIHLRVAGRDNIVLRRPFSVFKAGKQSLTVLFRIIGKGTKILAQLRAGDKANIIGPLGNGFPMPARNVYPVFVAGGYGSAALYLLAERTKKKGTLFIGGKTDENILCVDDFKKIGWNVIIATEDGSMGQKGLVTDILIKFMGISRLRRVSLRLTKLPDLSFRVKRGLPAYARAPARELGQGISAMVTNTAEIPSASSGQALRKTQDDKRVLEKKRQVVLYACGPMGMLEAVAKIAVAGGWKAWLSLDKNMGCGVGACLACVQKIRVAGGRGSTDSWKWARVCTEGPVFECREIVWGNVE